MIAFVTGGSRGIGEAIVYELLSAGHDVAFTYRSSAERAERVLSRARDLAPDRKCKAYRLDVRSSVAVEEVADRVLEEFDTVHAVIANAGISINGLAVSMADEDWKEVIDTNLTGTFYVCRQFLTTMLGNGFGRIVMIGSLSAGGVTGQVSYAASKAGMLGLSRTLAKEYGRRGITSNVVVPGFFDTDMTRDGMSGDNKEFWLQYCPVGRMGKLEEVSKVVSFLLTDGAAYVNGQAIEVNGGLEWAP